MFFNTDKRINTCVNRYIKRIIICINRVNNMLINEVAKLLNISVNTLRLWQKIFDIPIQRDDKNNRVYNTEAIELIKQIKALRDEGQGINAIKKSLINICDNSINTCDNIRAIIKAEIQEQTELSEKYAKATYMIGQLEEKVKTYENKIKLLPVPDEFNQIKCERDIFKRDKELLQQQLQQAQEELTLFKMPWYRKLFMRVQVAKI